MQKSAKSKAEQMFSASQKKADQFLKQKEKAWQELTEKTARLKARRLEKEAAEAAEAGKATINKEKS
jgi:hypothetical protein